MIATSRPILQIYCWVRRMSHVAWKFS